MRLRLITPPTYRPVSQAIAEKHLRISPTDAELLYVEGLIEAATQYAQEFTLKQLAQAEYEGLLDEFPAHAIQVPIGPLVSVESIEYIAPDGSTQQLASFEVDATRGRITPAYGEFWPATRVVPNAVKVSMTLGYADGAIPFPIKAALLLLVGDLYENREAQQGMVLYENKTVERLLYPYRGWA